MKIKVKGNFTNQRIVRMHNAINSISVLLDTDFDDLPIPRDLISGNAMHIFNHIFDHDIKLFMDILYDITHLPISIIKVTSKNNGRIKLRLEVIDLTHDASPYVDISFALPEMYRILNMNQHLKIRDRLSKVSIMKLVPI